MTVNGVDGGNQPLNNSKKASEPRVIKSGVDKGSVFKEQVRNDCGQIAREITYFDFNKDGEIKSNEILSVSQYIYHDKGVDVNQFFDLKNANGEGKPDGKVDAEFKTFQYDLDGNLTNKWNDKLDSLSEYDIERFTDLNKSACHIEQTNTTENTENVTTTIPTDGPTTESTGETTTTEVENITTETIVTSQTTGVDEPQSDVVMVKEGVDKGAKYKEQIMEKGKVVAEFSYYDYNKDGNIDTSEMTSASFYQYNGDGVQIAQYVDADHDYQTDGEIREFEYDTDGNRIKSTVDKDEAYKGLDMGSLREAFINPLDEIIENAIDEELKKDK